MLEAAKQAGIITEGEKDKKDETLEVGLAAGLDIPTALVLADSQTGYKSSCEGCLVAIVVVLCLLWELLSWLSG